MTLATQLIPFTTTMTEAALLPADTSYAASSSSDSSPTPTTTPPDPLEEWRFANNDRGEINATTNYPDEASSIYTDVFSTSTSSTIPGIGALSGKAIKALGASVLRMAERVVITRALARIKPHFPHVCDAKSSNDTNLEEMYEIVLELCRYVAAALCVRCIGNL